MKALLRWFDSCMPSMREKASQRHAPKNWYVSGPHTPDYYLLLDEGADSIFAMRLAAHMREACCTCAEQAHLAAASRLEIWMDDAGKQVWYVFEGSPQ
jgi:hypothetical protein